MRSDVNRTGRTIAVAALVAVGCLSAAMTLFAQEQEQPTRRQARQRLPNYYTQVVNEEQREAVYGIQKKYEPDVAKLRKQLEELITKRDAEIRDLLTPEQQKRVDELREEARKRRQENRRNRQNTEEEAAAEATSTEESSPR